MKIAITGHRPNKLGNDYELKSPLIQWIKMEILKILDREKPDELITGMALGIDTLFALIGIERGLKITAAIPCDDQERMWPVASKQMYYMILNNPLVTKVVVSPGPYAAWKMQTRNEWMVDYGDKLISVWDGTKGGTFNCITYATMRKKEIIRIDPNDFEDKMDIHESQR
jgi:uncharacterized phage-like protein YoqJ